MRRPTAKKPPIPCPNCGTMISYVGHLKPGTRSLCLECRKYFSIPGEVKPAKDKAKSESSIQDAIIKHLSGEGWMVVRVNSSKFQDRNGTWVSGYHIYGITQMPMDDRFSPSSGFPDVMAFKDDSFLLLEVKDATGKAQESQKKFAEFAGKIYGIDVHLVRSVEDVKELLCGRQE
jgi:hypothetical protein